MVVIKHLSGGLRGEEQTITDDRERILFGRSATCDVIFPPEETVVGREHFALVRKTEDSWSIDLWDDHYVEVNGVQAQSAQPLPKDATIRLGNDKGPSFEVIVEPAAKKQGVTTAPQKKPPPLPVRLRRHARTGIAAFLIVLAAGLGFFYYYQTEQEEAASQRDALRIGQDRLKEARDRDAKELGQLASERISPEAQQRLARAAFLVMAELRNGTLEGFGTAWPVGPSLLGTNAHVAKPLAEYLKAGGKVFVRAPGPSGAAFEVVKAEIHPGYLRFPAYVLEQDVVTMEPSGPTHVAAGSVYDVGLLHIKGEVSPDAILEVASEEELRKLTVGTLLAQAGYPMAEVAGAHLQDLAPRPELRFGQISSFTDAFNLPTDDTNQRLVLFHSIPSAGGASGSAIIGPSGKVVALLNAGNEFSFMTEKAASKKECQVQVDWEKREISPPPSKCYSRVPSAVLINLAQRADMLTDLIEGRTEEALADDQAYWDKRLANFERGSDVFISAALEKIKPPQAGATLELVSEERGVLSEADAVARGKGRNRIKGHKVTLEAGVPTLFLVYSERHQPLWLFLQDPESLDVKESNQTGTTTPTISYTADTEETGLIAVQGPDVDTPYVFRIYKWKPAES